MHKHMRYARCLALDPTLLTLVLIKLKLELTVYFLEYRCNYKFRFAIAKMQNQVYVIGGKTAQWPAMTQGYLFYYAGNGKQAVFRPITVLRTHFLSKG